VSLRRDGLVLIKQPRRSQRDATFELNQYARAAGWGGVGAGNRKKRKSSPEGKANHIFCQVDHICSETIKINE
jgi:hypothetical protein